MTNGRCYRLGGLFKSVLTVPLLLLGLLAVASCTTSEGSPAVTIEFAPGYSVASAVSAGENFNETGSVVVRSMSLAVNERGITVSPTKSKDAVISTLIFVRLSGQWDSGDSVPVACVSVTGKEYEYDMATAKFYTMSSRSAVQIASVYGIVYDVWQTGASDSSDKYPCCQ